jgi:hypothetical protein
MASEFAHTYIHIPSIGNFDACSEFQNSVAAIFDNLYARSVIDGFQMMIIENELQEMEELIPVGLITEIVKGNFPYVYTRIQSVDGNDFDIDGIMKEYNAIRIK